MDSASDSDASFQATTAPPAPPQTAVSSPFNSPPLNSHPVHELTVSELQHHYASSSFAIAEYTQSCIDRILATNPYLEAVIEVNPDALNIANSLDLERQQALKKGQSLGPMHGVPVLVKDTMATADRMQTTGGHWDWERYGDTNPEKSEITVSKVQTYYLMKEYLSRLKNTPTKSLEDIVRFNDENNGSKAGIGGLPAWMDGQNLFRKCVATQGIENDIYCAALDWIRKQTGENGIDAALKHRFTDADGNEREEILDALLFCDIKLAGTNIAAQTAYPVVSIPIGLDPDGMPVGLTIQHTMWEDARCIKWASAIEDLIKHENEKLLVQVEGKDVSEDERRQWMLGRVPPVYKEHLRKNIPVEYQWRYKGAPKYNIRDLRAERLAKGEE